MNSSTQTITPPDAAAALGEDVAARRHLLWLSGVRGAREAVWTMLRESRPRALFFRVSPRQAGDLLPQVLTGLGLTFNADAVVSARRELALRLTAAAQQEREIVVIVDPAHQFDDDDDVGILLHFFPPGPTTIVFGGQGDPRTWRPYGAARERALESAAHYVLAPPLAAVRARSVVAPVLRSSNVAAPEPSVLNGVAPPPIDDGQFDGTSSSEAPLPRNHEADALAIGSPPAHEPGVAPVIVDGRPDYVRQSRQRQELERQLQRWRTLAIALMGVLVVVGTIEFFDIDASRWLSTLRDDAPTSAPADAPPRAARSGLPEQPAGELGASTRDGAAGTTPMPDEQTSNAHRSEPPPAPESATAPTAKGTPVATDSSANEPTIRAEAPPSPSAESLAREATATSAAEPADPHAAMPAREPAPRKRSSTRETRGKERYPRATTADAQDASPQSGAEVETLAEMYADRAEYELQKGRPEDATASIARGLAIAPDNTRLLSLQVVLRSANSPQAPPFSKSP